jgi:kynurenine 3-monooxygenase
MDNNIVILGAGPSGLLLAYQLLAGNYAKTIKVLERAPTLQDRRNAKSFSFALFRRGFAALAQAPGLDETVRQRSTRIATRVQRWLPAAEQKVAVKHPFMLCERNELVGAILDTLQRDFGERFQIEYGCTCEHVDLDQKSLTLRDSAGQRMLTYSLLFGADGAGSALRTAMLERPGYECEDQPYSRVYRNFYLDQSGVKQLGIGSEELHAWMLPGGLMVGAVPHEDGSATCNIVFPMTGGQECEAARQLELMQESCPEIVAAMSDREKADFVDRPILQCRTIKLNRYHYADHACLLGDAAHAVPPSVGQGCNSALEDAVIIARLLGEHATIGNALEAFSSERVPDMHALLTLSLYAMPLSPALRRWYEYKSRLTDRLHGLIPGVRRANLLDYLAQSLDPYSDTLAQRQGWINRVEKSNRAFLETRRRS